MRAPRPKKPRKRPPARGPLTCLARCICREPDDEALEACKELGAKLA